MPVVADRGDEIARILAAPFLIPVAVCRSLYGQSTVLVMYPGLFHVSRSSALLESEAQVASPSIRLFADGADADDGFHLGIILGSGLGDKFYFVYIGGG